jgi:hypothetical protein
LYNFLVTNKDSKWLLMATLASQTLMDPDELMTRSSVAYLFQE